MHLEYILQVEFTEHAYRKLMRVIKDNSKNFDYQQIDVSPFTQTGKNRGGSVLGGRGGIKVLLKIYFDL